MAWAVLGFLGAATLLIVLPGPDTLVVLRNLLRDGPANARRTALGVLAGLTVWAAAAAAGLSALVGASRIAYDGLRIAGAIYLGVLGVQSLRSRVATAGPAEATLSRGVVGRGFVGGLTTNLLNPKVGAFFVTFLPAFVPHGEPVGWVTLLLGLIYVVETGLYFAFFLRFADRIVALIKRPRIRKLLDRGSGAVLLGFAARLALEP